MADASGRGEGYLYLGRCVDGGSCNGPYIASAADGDPAAGSVKATLLSAGIAIGDSFSATEVNPTSGTSEFSVTVVAPAVLSVSASSGAFAFGTQLLNSWLSAQSSLLTNDGNVAANLVGQITQLTDGSSPWGISGAGNGVDVARAQYSTTSASGPWTDIAAYDSDFTIANGVARNGTATLWLRIQTPTSTSSFIQHGSALKVYAR